MTARLPKVLAEYFAATNAHDVGAMIAAFAEDATVHDEGRDHVGVSAIRTWMEETIEKYDYKVEPIESSRNGSSAVVLVSLRGKFPGSPISLQYAFTLSAERVARLEIG
jgi:ketosteroid isomerase-like protein